MQSSDVQKKVVFLCPGPEYLFWAVGVYYAWELSREYHVVLILDFPFAQLCSLEQLRLSGVLRAIVPHPSCPDSLGNFRKAWQRHRHFAQISDTLFETYQPVAIFQHTDLEPANIYLFDKARFAGCARIIYRPSKIARNYYDDYLLMREWILTRLRQKHSFPYWVALVYFGVRKFLSYYLNYVFFPFWFKRKIFRPRISAVARRHCFINGRSGYFDDVLIHSEYERRISIMNGEPSTVIRSPLWTVGDEVHLSIYGRIEQREEIVIFPSNGEIECVRKKERMSDAQVVEHYCGKWTRVIDILHEKFPTCNLCLKLHPSQVNDRLFLEVVRGLRGNCNMLTVYPVETRAEELILGARVVVSTCSSVLWWASQLKAQKVLISVNCFNIPEGDAYAEVRNIHYFDDLQKMAEYDFSDVGPKSEMILTPRPLIEFMRTRVSA